MKRKVVAYIRVSTEEQARHGFSIEAQTQVLHDYAKGNDLAIVEQFVEKESAYKPGRPLFRDMLQFLKRRRDVTGVLCYKIDRIARNLQDYSALTEIMGIEIISATEKLPANSTGELMGGMQAVFARFYSAQLSERVALGLETKAKKGLWPTFAPTGYVNDRSTSGIVPDMESSPMIRELFEQYARSDMSLTDLTIWARERGLRSRYGSVLAKSAVHKLLMNPVYYGGLNWKGRVFEGKHEPIISRQLYDRVQERLHAKPSNRHPHSFPYRGLLVCGFCGCAITAEVKKGKYVYYRCSFSKGKCEQPYHPQERLSMDLLTVIKRVHLSPSIVMMLERLLLDDHEERSRMKKARILQLKSELARIAELRDSAYLEKLEGGVEEERWISVDSKLGRRTDLVLEEMAQLREERAAEPDSVRRTLELLKRAPEMYLRQNHENRARLLKIVSSNCILGEESIVPVYRKPFTAIAESLQSGIWLGEEDSNPH